MVESALTFNEHDIHLITKELQGSPDNTPIKDTLFQKKFEDFINGKKDINNDITLDKSFDALKEELINIKNNCMKKLFWIFFWYIKWQKEFISDKYIIIQNLEFHTKIPSIIDIKLGNEKKISKEKRKVKIFKGAYESLGCRIMGISSNNLYFKSRYETKERLLPILSARMIR